MLSNTREFVKQTAQCIIVVLLVQLKKVYVTETFCIVVQFVQSSTKSSLVQVRHYLGNITVGTFDLPPQWVKFGIPKSPNNVEDCWHSTLMSGQ